MSTVQDAIYTYLSSSAGLQVLIEDRIYPSQAPTTVHAPFLIYNMISTLDHRSMAGTGNLEQTTIQFDAYASSKVQADAIERALFDVLQDCRGQILPDIFFDDAARSSRYDGLNFPDDGSDEGTFRVTVEYIIKFRRAVPAGQ